MKPLFTVLPVLLLLTACTRTPDLNLIVEDATGLSDESPVLLNGFTIGEVYELELLPDQRTLVKVLLTEDVNLPIDSRFISKDVNFLGNTGIYIELGESEELVSRQDTLYATYLDEPNPLEEAMLKVMEKFVEIADTLEKKAGSGTLTWDSLKGLQVKGDSLLEF